MSSPAANPIAILGFPRSGTTLLRRILDAHSHIDCPGETYLLSAAARFIQAQRVVDGLEPGVLTGIQLLGGQADDVLAALRNLVFELRARRLAVIGKPRWAEKTAVDAFHLDAIQTIFGPRLVYICVVRHGLDVVASTQEWCTRLESYPDELHRYIARYPQPLVAFAHAWVDVMATFDRFAAASGQGALVVRYEDLTADTEATLRRILEFLGESWEDDLLARALEPHRHDGFGDWKAYGRASIDAESVGRWRRLAPGTIRQLAEIVNPTITRWGYAAVEPTTADDQAEALRRYQMGIAAQSLRRDSGKSPSP